MCRACIFFRTSVPCRAVISCNNLGVHNLDWAQGPICPTGADIYIQSNEIDHREIHVRLKGAVESTGEPTVVILLNDSGGVVWVQGSGTEEERAIAAQLRP